MNATSPDPQLVQRAQAAERAGRLPEAETLFRELLARHGELPQVMHALGLVLHRMGRSDEAIELLRQAAERAPDDAMVRNNLANLLNERGHQRRALAAYEDALRLQPDYVNARFNLARLYERADRLEEAEQHLREVVRLAPNDAGAWNALAAVLSRQGDLSATRAAVERAYALDPRSPDVLVHMGVLHMLDGDADGANQWYERALAADPGFVGVYEKISGTRRFGEADRPFIERVAGLLDNPSLEQRARAALHFALGKMYDDCGEYDRAFGHYREGNRLRPPRVPFDRERFAGFIDAQMRVFDQRWFAERAGHGHESTLPVFIVGMMRSGTTLAEQLLASHPQVLGAGELPTFPTLAEGLPRWLGSTASYPECAREMDASRLRAFAEEYLQRLPANAREVQRVTDKLPFNFLHLGLIASVFPRASLVYCERSAVDVCLSNYFQSFTGGFTFTGDLLDIAFVYRQHERLMTHWRAVLGERVLGVRYEAVVTDLGQSARRLVAHCGLPWDDEVLRYTENRRSVATASTWQVRQPVYTRSMERWRNYERHIGPLLEALGA